MCLLLKEVKIWAKVVEGEEGPQMMTGQTL